MFGGFRYFERKEIKDTLGYVRLAINPSDNDAFLRVVNYPRRGIGASAVAEVAMAAARHGMSYLEVVRHPGLLTPASAKKLTRFAEVADAIAGALGGMRPVDFMKYVIKESGLENTLKLSEDPEDRNRFENIEGLVDAVKNFVDDNPEATMSDFMQSVSLVSDSDGMDEENYVTLATVHAVKGLEFGNVFVVGAEENIFPTQAFIDRVGAYTSYIYVTIMWDEATNGFCDMNGDIVFYYGSGEDEGSKTLKLWCSNNDTVLKDTDWFRENRTWSGVL